MKLFSKLFLVTFFIFTNTYFAAAQRFNPKKRYWSLGGSLNAMNYAGDLDPNTFVISPALGFTRWNLGLCVMYRYAPRVSFRGTFAYGRIEGDDRKTQKPDISTKESQGWRYIRGANFVNDLFEFKADVVYDFFENRGRYNKRVAWTPYVFGGLAYFIMIPKADYGNGLQLLSEVLPANTFSAHQISIPVGVGVRFSIAKLFDLSFELGLRKTFTGYLDGTRGAYLDPRTLNSDQKLFDNPSMVGYGSNPDVTRVINQQGLYMYDDTGFKVDLGTSDGTENLIIQNADRYAGVTFEGTPYITPRGFGWGGDKKAEFQPDWYIVAGFQLTYILPERVQCPKYRD